MLAHALRVLSTYVPDPYEAEVLTDPQLAESFDEELGEIGLALWSFITELPEETWSPNSPKMVVVWLLPNRGAIEAVAAITDRRPRIISPCGRPAPGEIVSFPSKVMPKATKSIFDSSGYAQGHVHYYPLEGRKEEMLRLLLTSLALDLLEAALVCAPPKVSVRSLIKTLEDTEGIHYELGE